MEQIVVPTLKLQCPFCNKPIFEVKNLLAERIRCPECSEELVRGVHYRSDLIKLLVDQAEGLTTKDPRNALVLLNAVLDADDRHAKAHSLAGFVYARQGDTTSALSHHKRAVELDPGRSEFHFDLGVDFINIDKWPEAQAEFEKAVEILPDYLWALNALVRCYLTQYCWVEAAIVCYRLMDLDDDGPTGREASLFSSDLHSNPQHPDKQAQQIIQRIAAALSLESDENWEKARELFEQCKEELPEKEAAWCMVCEYLSNQHIELNQHRAALDLSTQAHKYLPCVAAIVPGHVIPVLEPGIYKDADRLYARLLEEKFGVQNPDISRVRDSEGKLLIKASVSGRDFLLQRAGNVIRIRSDEDPLQLAVYEESYRALKYMY